jgi:hypothetical protein
MTRTDIVAAHRRAQERVNTPQGADRFKRTTEADATSVFITGCCTVATAPWLPPQNRFDLAPPTHSRGLIQIHSVEGCSDFQDRELRKRIRTPDPQITVCCSNQLSYSQWRKWQELHLRPPTLTSVLYY